jgi:hypothetical protein
VDRPGLDALLAYAREGDTLAVVRLDRLGRSLGEANNPQQSWGFEGEPPEAVTKDFGTRDGTS